MGAAYFRSACSCFIFLNGHVVSHLLTGHAMDRGAFAMRIPVPGANVEGAIAGDVVPALSLTAMIAIGGWHIFVWPWLFAVVWSLRCAAHAGVCTRR